MFDSHYWDTGRNGKILFQFPRSVNGWSLELEFDRDTTALWVWNGSTEISGPKSYRISDKGYNAVFSEGAQINLGFQVTFERDVGPPEARSLKLDGHEICGKIGSIRHM